MCAPDPPASEELTNNPLTGRSAEPSCRWLAGGGGRRSAARARVLGACTCHRAGNVGGRLGFHVLGEAAARWGLSPPR